MISAICYVISQYFERLIIIKCTKQEFIEAAVSHVFVDKKWRRSLAATSKKSDEIPMMNITDKPHFFFFEIRQRPALYLVSWLQLFSDFSECPVQVAWKNWTKKMTKFNI